MEEKFYLNLDRVPVFIGKSGKQKEIFEEKFGCKLEINSKNGEVIVESEDSLSVFILSNIVHAINYGFSPDHAIFLEDENNVLDVIDVKTIVRDSNRLKVVLGRVIGKDGSTRKAIEEITKCFISVSDHYIGIIGAYENVQLVHEALDMLIKGSSHKSFYSYLERNKIGAEGGLM